MCGFLSKVKRKNKVPSKHCINVGMTKSTSQPTKITDVNQFYLEKIFTYLDLKDLLNVADANTNLRIATYLPYIRQDAKKTMKFIDDCCNKIKKKQID